MNSINVPQQVLSALIDMACLHVQDIETGIVDGTYEAAENKDLGTKQKSVAVAQIIYSEATLSASKAIEWLKEHNPGRWAELLCNAKNVRLTEAKEKDLRGWWGWVNDSGTESDSCFRTIEEAALDAVEVLGLAA